VKDVIREVIGERSLRDIGRAIGEHMRRQPLAASTVHAWVHGLAKPEVDTLTALLDVCEASLDLRCRTWVAFGVPESDVRLVEEAP
jgi:hypothetical protein